MCLYPVDRSAYSSLAAHDFRERALPAMIRWLDERASPPETQELGVAEELVVQYDAGSFVLTELKRR